MGTVICLVHCLVNGKRIDMNIGTTIGIGAFGSCDKCNRDIGYASGQTAHVCHRNRS